MVLITKLLQQLQNRANPRTKAWWESYLKRAIPFRGVQMADIRAALHEWYAREKIGARLSQEQQKVLAVQLLQQQHCEDKLAGILFWQEILLPAGAANWRKDLPRFARLFEQGHIYEWNTCDWFCVRVLGPLVQREGKACARAIAAWRHAAHLWQRRAAGVAFVNLAKKGEANFAGFSALVLKVCAATVKSPERFAQTGTGWVLRELSHAHPEKVAKFITRHIRSFSSEGLSYAIAGFPPETKLRFKRSHRAAARPAAGSLPGRKLSAKKRLPGKAAVFA